MAVTVACAVAGTGLFVLGLTGGRDSPPQPPAAAHASAPPSVAPAAVASPIETAEQTRPQRSLSRSAPAALHIPSIDLHTPNLMRLGLTPDGRLQTPQAWQAVGWYTRGPAPGEEGPAVLAGHVDSDDGPAVFYRIGELDPGDTVKVRRADGTTAVFRVYTVDSYPKAEFPTEKVYGATDDRAELRLITCGGAFNRETQHYVSNVVAFARMVATR